MQTTLTSAGPASPPQTTEHGRWGLFAAAVPVLLFVMFALPKGGFKAGDVPITFGYLLTPALLLGAILRGATRELPLDRLLLLCTTVTLSAWSLVVVAVNGTDSPSFTLAYFVAVIYLPFFGLIVFSDLTLRDLRPQVEAALLWSVRFAVAYGLFLFVYKQVTGAWVEIPYITVNVDDVGNLDSKYINRGGIYKLISTYNNGNLFGVTMAILGPLYLRLERRLVLHWLFYGALLLTLSRTVWIGMILIFGMRMLSPGVRASTLLYLLGGLLVSALGISYALSLFGKDLSFLFDKDLGGRAIQLKALVDPHVIPDQLVPQLPEIVFTGVLAGYGYPGLALFALHLLLPSLLLWLEGTPLLSLSRASACLQGLLIYFTLAFSDAAFNLIPVMQAFWMVTGLGLWYVKAERLTPWWSRAAAR